MAKRFRIAFADPYITEEDISDVCKTVRRKCFSQGEYVEKFEKVFTHSIGVEHAVAVSSGTSALHVALAAIGVHPSDEVIVPSFNLVATVNCVLYQGAKPVFVNIDPLTHKIDSEKIAEEIMIKRKP